MNPSPLAGQILEEESDVILLALQIDRRGYGEFEWFQVWITGASPACCYFGKDELRAKSIFDATVKNSPALKFANEMGL